MLKLLRITGIVEGISFLLLLGLAMPLKYLGGIPEGVKIIGPIHGVLFLAYLFLIFNVHLKGGTRWSILAIIGAILPFGSFAFDRFVAKHGGWDHD